MTERIPDEAEEEFRGSPQELCQKLESIELNDDETESLLQEALALNKRLKAELKRRENEGNLGDSDENYDAKDYTTGSSPVKQSAKNRRPGQKKDPLPPIAPKKGQSLGPGGHQKGGSVRSRGQPERRGASSPAPHATVGRIVNSAGSVEGSQRRAKSAKDKDNRPTRSAEQRKKKPEWNDRFSFE